MSRSKKPQLRRYILPGDWPVLAGKSAKDNDRLSTEIAQPDDWWFHVRGVAGSHVVLQAREEEEVPAAVLRQAAAIAAYHSKARDEDRVEVTYTRARHVRKVPGLPVGVVLLLQSHSVEVAPGLPVEKEG